MTTYIVVSIVSGILFAILDGSINANPLARRLYDLFKPIARTSINPLAPVVIDLVYGFLMSWIFLLLYQGLPGETGLVKGISFGFFAWFFRVVMSTASQWVLFNVPVRAMLYSLATGLGEMLILGLLYGLTLEPTI